MSRRTSGSARQRAALFDLPRDEAALLRRYTLSDDNIEHIRVQHGGHNRLGFALQLCTFRSPLGWAHILLTSAYRWPMHR